MGAKISMLAYSDGDARAVLRSAPVLDRPQSERFAKTLFAGAGWEVGGDGDLLSSALPAKNEIYVGCFPGLRIVTAAEVGIDYPSRLPASPCLW